MEIRVLGCSGGIGDDERTTSFLINRTILIDAGTGVSDLSVAEMQAIEHIFITHSHLDHILSIPLLIDTIFDSVCSPVQVYAIERTIQALKQHLFNWVIWPDFSKLPTPEAPVLAFNTLADNQLTTLEDITIEAIPVNHVVPTVGYLLHDRRSGGNFAFSGDTTTNETLWKRLNRLKKLDLLFIETAFPNKDRQLCHSARHYCPETLALDLEKLRLPTTICLSHTKPGSTRQILQECRQLIKGRELHHLQRGDTFSL
ncbi:3',5'-cyclic-nucleotide phosphodiesterase [Ectothiorhodospiraceae bacterium BW-2]|nr:3',5'-cyclic-nucleotide phosphodiesterase [Ectothiorhodospiraceae bacterium BW-2]